MPEEIDNNDFRRASAVKITRRVELNFWRTCLLNAAGLSLAWATNPNIEISNPLSFALLVVLIWFLNWILKPILVVFALPFIIFTVGIGMLFINALILYFASRLIPGDGIIIGSYWSALWASFWVSVLSWGFALAKSERLVSVKKSSDEKQKDDNDVIDV